MGKRNWKSEIEYAKRIQQGLKTQKAVGEFLKAKPNIGYMYDTMSKKEDKIVKLSECKSSTLRRFVKMLTKYYGQVTAPSERRYINIKLRDVHSILDKRPDALIEKE